MTTPTALLLIDAQSNMFDPAHPVQGAGELLPRLEELLGRFRAAGAPIVFVRNCGGADDPDAPDTPGWQLHPRLTLAEGDPVFDKTTCDTFASTPLGESLQSRGVTRVVIAGLQSEYCIRETTLGALERGFEVTLVSDGHSTYAGGGRTAEAISAAVNAELAGRVRLLRADEIAVP